ncbi:MAG: hypothetical protein AVDCRST_MAG10-3499, partial [uncultured Acidimicrobiales bacterium]
GCRVRVGPEQDPHRRRGRDAAAAAADDRRGAGAVPGADQRPPGPAGRRVMARSRGVELPGGRGASGCLDAADSRGRGHGRSHRRDRVVRARGRQRAPWPV